MSTTASIKQLTTPVLNEHAQYDAYRGNLVEPVQCENCVDVFVMKEPFIMSVKQVNLMWSQMYAKKHKATSEWSPIGHIRILGMVLKLARNAGEYH